jgi:hypothetical protein
MFITPQNLPLMKTNLSILAQIIRLITRNTIHKNVDEHDSDLKGSYNIPLRLRRDVKSSQNPPKPSTNLAQNEKHLHIVCVSVSFSSSETGE